MCTYLVGDPGRALLCALFLAGIQQWCKPACSQPDRQLVVWSRHVGSFSPPTIAEAALGYNAGSGKPYWSAGGTSSHGTYRIVNGVITRIYGGNHIIPNHESGNRRWLFFAEISRITTTLRVGSACNNTFTGFNNDYSRVRFLEAMENGSANISNATGSLRGLHRQGILDTFSFQGHSRYGWRSANFSPRPSRQRLLRSVNVGWDRSIPRSRSCDLAVVRFA
jgi:hypothetical protein